MSEEKHWLENIRTDAFPLLGGWVNSITGRGDPDSDKNAATSWTMSPLLPDELLASLFRGNSLARAICIARPEWALRNGWDMTLDRDAVESQDIESSVRAKMGRLGAHEAMLRAAVWGQVFGGGLLLVGVNDGQPLEKPLDESKIKSIDFLRVVARSCVEIETVYSGATQARFGEPASYKVREVTLRGSKDNAGPQHTTVWHASRVILFPGPLTDDDGKRDNEGWDQSVLDVVIRDLLKHDGMWDDTGGMVADGSQGVWKIKNLMQAVTNGMKSAVEDRMKLADRARSVFRAILLDADKESFEYIHRQFAGISELLAQSTVRTAGAAQIPATVLMGQSPAGMNATGESDLELWYARVREYGASVVESRLARLVRLILLSKDGPTQGKEPEKWAVMLADPRSLTPMQRGELRARQAQVDAAMIANRVITPEEVAVNRYTAEGWSDVTQIDLSWRRAFLAFASKEITAEVFPGQLERWLSTVPQGVQTEAGGLSGLPAIGPGEGKEAAQNPKTGAPE